MFGEGYVFSFKKKFFSTEKWGKLLHSLRQMFCSRSLHALLSLSELEGAGREIVVYSLGSLQFSLCFCLLKQ